MTENRETTLSTRPSTAASSVVKIVPEKNTKDVNKDDIAALIKESEEKEAQQQAATVRSKAKVKAKGPSVVDTQGTLC